jgi:hypothetical protein
MMIDKGNRSTFRKLAPVPLCPPQTPHACPDANLGRRGGKPATNRLSYGTAKKYPFHGTHGTYPSKHKPATGLHLQLDQFILDLHNHLPEIQPIIIIHSTLNYPK